MGFAVSGGHLVGACHLNIEGDKAFRRLLVATLSDKEHPLCPVGPSGWLAHKSGGRISG
jgi:hypothetical protein